MDGERDARMKGKLVARNGKRDPKKDASPDKIFKLEDKCNF